MRLNNSNSILSAAFGPLSISPIISEPVGKSCSNRLASTPHINENSLPKMPTQKLIYRSLRIIKKSLIKMFASNDIVPGKVKLVEADNLVIILR
jgi:hypothetical protein